MAVYKDFIAIAGDTAFQNRVLYALEIAAIAVMAEANTPQGHAQRVSYARQILADGTTASIAAARAILTNASIAAEADITKNTNGDYGIPDADIQFAVNGLFGALAGVAN